MIAAGVQNTGPQGTIQGVAPRLFWETTKFSALPAVNDYTFSSAPWFRPSTMRWLTHGRGDALVHEGDAATEGPARFGYESDRDATGTATFRVQAGENARGKR